MKFSILICTLKKREFLFQRLLSKLTSQKTDNVEIIWDLDSGEKTVGFKRNGLLDRAIGDYVAFVDDDDLVSDNYVQKILEAIKVNPDVVGFNGMFCEDNKPPKKFTHTIKCQTWYEDCGVYMRNPNHLNPVKRKIALAVKFPELNRREDYIYSQAIYPHLKSEVFITDIMYYYLYSKSTSETQKD